MINYTQSRLIQIPQQTIYQPKIQNYQGQITNYNFIKQLGKGAFSQVVLVQDKRSCNYYALKIINKDQMIECGAVENVSQEIKIQMKMKHENILPIIELFEDVQNIFILLEYCSGGNLFQKMIKENRLNQFEIARITIQVLKGIEYMHSQNVIHRDIKPENILIANDGSIKICDFGWACNSKQRQQLKYVAGTTEFMPPEIIQCQSHGPAVDIWSLGVLIYEIAHGHLPFKGRDTNELKHMIIQVNYQLNYQIPEEVSQLIQGLIQYYEQNRLSIPQIWKSSLIVNYQTKQLSQSQKNYNPNQFFYPQLSKQSQSLPSGSEVKQQQYQIQSRVQQHNPKRQNSQNSVQDVILFNKDQNKTPLYKDIKIYGPGDEWNDNIFQQNYGSPKTQNNYGAGAIIYRSDQKYQYR